MAKNQHWITGLKSLAVSDPERIKVKRGSKDPHSITVYSNHWLERTPCVLVVQIEYLLVYCGADFCPAVRTYPQLCIKIALAVDPNRCSSCEVSKLTTLVLFCQIVSRSVIPADQRFISHTSLCIPAHLLFQVRTYLQLRTSIRN